MARSARVISIVGWVAVVWIFLRVASGGGTLRGVGYVLGTEPLGLVVLIVTSLIVAVVAIVAQVADVSWASPLSTAGAAIALITSMVLVLGEHDSAWVAGLASGMVLVVGIVRGRARSRHG